MWDSTRFHASKSTLTIPDSSYNAALSDRTIHLQKVIPYSTLYTQISPAILDARVPIANQFAPASDLHLTDCFL